MNENGKLTQRNKEMAEILSKQYVKAFGVPKPTDTTESENDDTINVNNIPDLQITEDNLVKAINELSQSAAPGPDGFPAILLKQCKEHSSLYPLEEKYGQRNCPKRTETKYNHTNTQRR